MFNAICIQEGWNPSEDIKGRLPVVGEEVTVLMVYEFPEEDFIRYKLDGFDGWYRSYHFALISDRDEKDMIRIYQKQLQ